MLIDLYTSIFNSNFNKLPSTVGSRQGVKIVRKKILVS